MEHGSCFLADAVVGDDRRYAIEAAERGELQCQAATTHQRTQIRQTSPVTNFSVATNEYRGGEERTEYHSIVTWERLAEICGQYLGTGQMVSLEGRLQTRRWEGRPQDQALSH
jgi:single stranded DNA-binding protein